VVVLLIIGLVLAVIGAGLMWWRGRVAGELSAMGIETSRAADVAAMAPGAAVEVKGILRAAGPLAGAFTGTPCAWYAAITYERVEEWEHAGHPGNRRLEEREHERAREVSTSPS